MGLFLIAMLLSAPDKGAAKQIELLKVPSEVYWASFHASGAKLCDPKLREHQEHEFDRRYGNRLYKLISTMMTHEKGQSQSGGLIVTSDCIAFRDHDAGKHTLSHALDDFDSTLAAMEATRD